CCQTEGKGHHLRYEGRRIDAEQTGNDHCNPCCDSRGKQFALLADILLEITLEQIMGYRCRDNQQETCCSGKCCSQPACRNQCNDPTRQVGDLRVCQNDDIAVNVQFGFRIRWRIADQTLVVLAALTGELR